MKNNAILLLFLCLLWVCCAPNPIRKLNTSKLPIGCAIFKQQLDQYCYYNEHEKFFILNAPIWTESYLELRHKQLMRQHLLAVFGQPIHSDGQTMCYNVMRDKDQPYIRFSNKNIRKRYDALVFSCQGDTILGCYIGICMGIQPDVIEGEGY